VYHLLRRILDGVGHPDGRRDRRILVLPTTPDRPAPTSNTVLPSGIQTAVFGGTEMSTAKAVPVSVQAHVRCVVGRLDR
jgi:hypothetical protein